MGLILAALYRKLHDKKQIRILMLGLDGAGKTTILYKLKFDGKLITTTPTIGFNVEIVKYKNLSLTIWDIGGQNTVRRLWHYYYQNTNAIIFVIDSSDQQRLHEVKGELHNLLEDYQLRDAVVLIFANKQDLQTSLSIDEIQEILEIRLVKNRNWHIQATSALRNVGLYEGLDWLAKQLS